ncbi:MAG: HAMP domain-containing sensor histidine kinase [Chitinophagaceae bacterium]
MRKTIPYILVMLSVNIIYAQPANKKILEGYAAQCRSLEGDMLFIEDRNAAFKGLQVTPHDDYYYLSLFTYYIGTSYGPYNQDSTIYYLEKSLDYARKGNNMQREIFTSQRLMYSYTFVKGFTEKRDRTAALLSKVSDTTTNKELKAHIDYDLSNYYYFLGNREKEMQYRLSNIEVFKEMIRKGPVRKADSMSLGVGLTTFVRLYVDLGEPLKGLQAATEARQYLKEEYVWQLSHWYERMVQIYIELKQPTAAKLYYDSLTSLLVKKNGSPPQWSMRIWTDALFARYYLSKNSLDTALYFAKLARATCISKYPTDSFSAADNHLLLGKIYVQGKDYDKALDVLKAASVFAGSGVDIKTSAEIYKTFAECYSAMGQWQMATDYYKKYIPLQDSISEVATANSIAEAEAKFQNREKQRQIELQRVQLSYSRNQRWWLIAGACFLLIMVGLLLFVYINKRTTAELLSLKNKDLEEANLVKAKLFSIISHDLRSPIFHLSQFLKLQHRAPHLFTEAEKSDLNIKLQAAAETLMDEMENLLLWSKTQLTQFSTVYQNVFLQSLVSKCIQLQTLSIESKSIVIENNISEQVQVSTDPDFLQTIVRNLLQNAINAANQNSTMKIEFIHQSVEGKIYPALSITNEGKPFNQEQYEQSVASNSFSKGLGGLGLRVVDELSRKIDVKVLFGAESPDKTKAILIFRKG